MDAPTRARMSVDPMCNASCVLVMQAPLQPPARACISYGTNVLQAEDELVHVMWYERVGAAPKPGTDPEQDIVVFPEECK